MNIVYNMLKSENVLKMCKLVILDECRVKKLVCNNLMCKQ